MPRRKTSRPRGADLDNDAETTAAVSRAMAILGRRGGRIGGKKRLDTLTPERRSEIARLAAKERWNRHKRRTR